MILEKKYFKPVNLPWAMALFLLRTIGLSFRHLISPHKISYQTSQLSQTMRFPQLKEGHSCHSCQVCVEICTTQALSLEGIDGEKPQQFKLNLYQCTACGDCFEVCPGEDLVPTLSQQWVAHGEQNPIIDLLAWDQGKAN